MAASLSTDEASVQPVAWLAEGAVASAPSGAWAADGEAAVETAPEVAPARPPMSHGEKEKLFRDLVTEHRVRLQKFVIKHIGHPDDADDIAQQAFAEAARTIERFRGESQLSTWLYGIAMNLVRNYISRAPHRVHKFESDDQLAELPSATGDPGDLCERRQLMETLGESFTSLPESMREVLMLVGVEEMSYEDAAKILSVPVGTVRSRLSRARSALKVKLEAAGVELPF